MSSFATLWREHFRTVWRTLARLGVPASGLDDAVQEVFLAVHRKLASFEGRSTERTWLVGIALSVARTRRRSLARRGEGESLGDLHEDPGPRPDEAMERRERLEALQRVLSELSDEQREVFVLMELEHESAPSVAATLEENVNTVYSRLRLAREAFNQAVRRLQGGHRE